MLDELDTTIAAAEHLYPDQEVAEPQPQQKETQGGEKDSNWRALRDRVESAERRSQELERIVQMNMNQQQVTKIEIEDNEDDIDISDDALIEGKHLKKYIKSLKQELKSNKKQSEYHNRQMMANQAEMMLKNKFSDFDTVVNKENIEKLAAKNPVLHRSLYANTDVYDFGYTAYELIKNSGIVNTQNSNNTQYEEIDRRVEENKGKPRSSASVSPQTADRPLARVGDYDRRVLTDARKRELREQVERYKQ